MKRISFIILTILLFANTFAQSLSVSSFKLLETDLTANTAGTMEIDQNGETAALIKVVTTQIGFTFDGGSLGIVKTKQTPSEVWVYIPRGSKKISIKHPQLGVLRDYYFPVAIEPARTYEMILVSGEVQTVVRQDIDSQYLVVKVTPFDAIVELDNEILPTTDGYAQKFVKLGSYDYRIQANNYHTAAGKVTVDDPNNKKLLEINLKPAFGWIEIPSHEEYNGAQVFIDNTLAGTIPMKSKELSSGEHSIKIVKTLFTPFNQTVTVNDNETTIVTPLLSANYSEVTITVDNDAEIFINEEKKGSGSWNGKLSSGRYLLEAKKEGHRSSIQSIDVISDQPSINIQMISPTPIYGQVNITSSPTMSDVYIDGSLMGQTPLYLPNILIGNHEVLIKHSGYNDFSTSIFIAEDTNIPLDVQLDNREMVNIMIECNLPDAIIFIDGDKFGKVSDLTCLESGVHYIRVVAKDYKDYTTTINTEDFINSIFRIWMEPKKNLKNAWTKIKITNRVEDVNGMKEAGFFMKYQYKLFSASSKKKCINKMKKDAAEMGANVILISEPEQAYSSGYVNGTAYKYKY